MGQGQTLKRGQPLSIKVGQPPSGRPEDSPAKGPSAEEWASSFRGTIAFCRKTSSLLLKEEEIEDGRKAGGG